VTAVQLPTRASQEQPRRPPIPRWAERLSGVVVLVGLWQLLSSVGVLSSDTLAGPNQVVAAGWDLAKAGTLGSAIWASLQRVLVGLAIGIPLGAALSLVAGLSRGGEDLVDAPMQALRFVPVLGLEPLIVLWFGIGNTAKISLIVFGVIFPIYINTSVAIRQIDCRHLELGRTLGLGPVAVVRRVVLPAALPGFLVGLRMSVAVSWLILVFAEQINATNGIGYLIVKAQEFFQSDTIIVGLAVYAILGLISDAIVRAIERRALAWLPNH
jgi:sulfonate transport system permease protein